MVREVRLKSSRMFSPVAVVGHQHPLSDLSLNPLIDSQEHHPIQIQGFTLGEKKDKMTSNHLLSKQPQRQTFAGRMIKEGLYSLPKAVFHLHSGGRSLASAECTHLHSGHPGTCKADVHKVIMTSRHTFIQSKMSARLGVMAKKDNNLFLHIV